MQSLLDQPVNHRGNAKLAHSLASGLGYLHPAHRLRLIAAFQQVFFDVLPVGLQIGLQLVDAHSVHSGCALIADHPPEAFSMFSRSTTASINPQFLYRSALSLPCHLTHRLRPLADSVRLLRRGIAHLSPIVSVCVVIEIQAPVL
jgi:hypothetical protein